MRETRIFSAPVEVREASDATATIAGSGAVFNVEYPVGEFTESVDPHAFNRTVKAQRDLAVVWSHDADRVLGTRESGTARFAIDDNGLNYEADLDLLDPDGLSAYRKITTGKVRQSSFSFEVVRDKWQTRDDAPPHRTLTEVRLWECSPVLWGANPATAVDMKRAVHSFAESRGLSGESIDSIDAVLAAERSTEPQAEATTETHESDPADHSDSPSHSEPKRIYHAPGT